MTATARIVVSQVSDVLKVPGAALRFDPPQDAPVAASLEDGDQDLPDWVWVLDDDGLPSAVRVSLGARNASAVQETGGTLAESQAVIVNYTMPAAETSLFGLRLGF